MKLKAISLIAGLMLAGPALADITNGPDPYTTGLGFDKPDDSTAAWGGWARGDASTVYAEWDTFSGGPGIPYSAVYGSSGASTHTLTWNPGTFAASTSGNLYSFSGTQVFDIDITPTSQFSGPVTVALQFETWGTTMDYSSILLNGVAPASSAVTYTDPVFPSSQGPVELNQYLAVWTLNAAPGNFHIDLQSTGPHQSFAQVAVDIASPVPEPGEWAMLLAGLGLMGAIVRRRSAGKGA